MKFYAKVTSNDLTKALGSISAWDGKTRLAVENALQNGTKAVARGAKQRVAQRSGKLKNLLKPALTEESRRAWSEQKHPMLILWSLDLKVIR